MLGVSILFAVSLGVFVFLCVPCDVPGYTWLRSARADIYDMVACIPPGSKLVEPLDCVRAVWACCPPSNCCSARLRDFCLELLLCCTGLGV